MICLIFASLVLSLLQITNEPCFVLYKEFKNPVVFVEKDADVEMIEKGM